MNCLSDMFILNSFLQHLVPEPPVIPPSSFLPIPFIAASLLYASPHTTRAVRNMASPSHHFLLSFFTTAAFAMIFGYLAFHQPFSLVDVVIAGLLVYGKLHLTVLQEWKTDVIRQSKALAWTILGLRSRHLA